MNTLTHNRSIAANNGFQSIAIAELRSQLPAGTIMLLRRLGFFEAFGVDAGYVSRALNQPARNVQFADQALPMFSIPADKAKMLAPKIANGSGLVVALVSAYPFGSVDLSRTLFIHPK